MTSTTSIVAGFPHQTLTRFAEPTFDTLTVLQRELNSNAESVYSRRGNGLTGHLVLTYQPDLFTALPGHMPFLTPT
jgi:hypothetical protein